MKEYAAVYLSSKTQCDIRSFKMFFTHSSQDLPVSMETAKHQTDTRESHPVHPQGSQKCQIPLKFIDVVILINSHNNNNQGALLLINIGLNIHISDSNFLINYVFNPGIINK